MTQSKMNIELELDVDAMPRRLDAVDAAARESMRLAYKQGSFVTALFRAGSANLLAPYPNKLVYAIVVREPTRRFVSYYFWKWRRKDLMSIATKPFSANAILPQVILLGYHVVPLCVWDFHLLIDRLPPVFVLCLLLAPLRSQLVVVLEVVALSIHWVHLELAVVDRVVFMTVVGRRAIIAFRIDTHIWIFQACQWNPWKASAKGNKR